MIRQRTYAAWARSGLGCAALAMGLATWAWAGQDFIKRGEEGWFWYETYADEPELEPKPAPPPMPAPPPAADPGPPPLSAAWYRATFSEFRDRRH